MNAELSDGAYELLRGAVNLARNEQLRTGRRLKQRMLECWPARTADIDEALLFWSRNIQERHPEGPPQ